MKSLIDQFLGFIFGQHHFWAGVRSFGIKSWAWMVDHQMMIFLGIIILCVLALVVVRLKRRYVNIRKLWIFILFFLTKRQMFLPLVYVLAKRQEGFDSPKLQELLTIREHCREKTFRHDPSQRMELEKKISKVLFEYFSSLESEQKLQRLSKFGKVVADLEFIDEKLVELQKLYNLESRQWNILMNIPVLNLFLWFFGMRKFDAFGAS